MNIINDFDFENAVKNVNSKLTPFKVIRNNKVKWAKLNLPLYFSIDYFICKGDLKRTFGLVAINFGFATAIELILNAYYKIDIYNIKSEINLRDLVKFFKDSNVDTSLDLIKNSEVYEKKYNVRLNEKKLPELVQSKYILVPTYDYLGDVKETSVLQEHVVGSKEYILSLGKPKKSYKLAYSNV